MSDRSKLYLVSILGISQRTEPGSDKPVGSYIHVPLLIIEQSIENASEEACVQANRMFTKELGFDKKHIAIQPIPPEAYTRFLQLSHLAMLADSDEPVEQAVEFMCSLAEPDPDNKVIFEFGELDN